MSENDSQSKTSEIYDALPFMEAFPFEDYEIALEAEGKDLTELGVSPILLNTLGGLGKQEYLAFYYIENESAVQISFCVEDIELISKTAERVKKLNSVLEYLDQGLKSESIEFKIHIIKKSKKFVKLLESENLVYAPFTEVLKEMLDLYKVTLGSSQILGVQRMNLQKIDENRLTAKQKDAILAFFNFQLHYVKILLGIVIAAKIF